MKIGLLPLTFLPTLQLLIVLAGATYIAFGIIPLLLSVNPKLQNRKAKKFKPYQPWKNRTITTAITVIFLAQIAKHFSKVFDIPFLSLGQRVIIAFGGFVFFTGLVALTLAILGAFNFVEVAVTLQRLGFGGEIFLGLGVINVITGILLSFRVKEK